MNVAVIGAANIDITAKPYGKYIPFDSNPGKITLSLGGVGRNICHNLSLLGINVTFLTALAADIYAKKIIDSCNELGISLSRAKYCPFAATSTYLCVMDNDGDLLSGVSDMDICKEVSAEYVMNNLEFLNSCDAVVFDTNLDETTIEYLLKNCTAPLFTDAVSVTKVQKLANVLDSGTCNLYSAKANRYEAEKLTGIQVKTLDDAEKCADILHSKGVKRVYITLGPDGVFASDGKTKVHIPSPTNEIVNATGAGDSFLAALVYAEAKQFDITDCAIIGQSASEITLGSENSVSERMSSDNLLKTYQKNKNNI